MFLAFILSPTPKSLYPSLCLRLLLVAFIMTVEIVLLLFLYCLYACIHRYVSHVHTNAFRSAHEALLLIMDDACGASKFCGQHYLYFKSKFVRRPSCWTEGRVDSRSDALCIVYTMHFVIRQYFDCFTMISAHLLESFLFYLQYSSCVFLSCGDIFQAFANNHLCPNINVLFILISSFDMFRKPLKHFEICEKKIADHAGYPMPSALC